MSAPTLKSRIGAFLDYFTTDSTDPIRRQRERVVVGSAFMLIVVACVFVSVWAFKPSKFQSPFNPITITISTSIVFALCVPFFLRRTGALAISATVLSVCTVASVGMAAAYNTGFRGLSMAWMTIIPLYMGFVVSPRAGWIAAFFIVAFEAVFAALTALHFDFPVVMSNDERLFGDVLAAMSAAFFAAAFTAFYENSRTDALEEKRRLERENEELAELNRLKSEFVAMISHELRTPLNAIIGFSRIVSQKAELDERQRENVDKIHYSGQHLLQIVDELLEVESIEAGMLKIVFAEVEFVDFIRKIAETSRPRAEEQGLKFVFESNGEAKISTDPQRLRQIADNLITNAIKYSETGTVTVRAYVRYTRFVFEVEDQGIGIPKDQQVMVFAPFRQVERSDTRADQGVGLGLYLVQKLTEALDGEITLESEPGVGTLFRVMFERRS